MIHGVDNHFNAYVASFKFHKVVTLEPDGRQGRQLISSDDGLAYSTGIYVDKSKNNVAVANDERGKVVGI